VAWVGHIWVDLKTLVLGPKIRQYWLKSTYTTVGTVCSATLLRCLVDLNVLDDQIASVHTLRICVCFGVLKESEKMFGGLYGPTSTSDAELLAYWVVTNTGQRFVLPKLPHYRT
jgi:hypothetical protein